MYSFRRLFVVAILPVFVLLGIQLKNGKFIEQLQLAVSPWVPQPLQELVFARPRITIRQGTVVGVTVRDTLKTPVDAFRGIPYALPPVGERRFRSAEPVGESDHILDASQFGARCPGKQLLKIGGDIKSSEDCLTVNVFRPHHAKDKLPVAVYVHGGAYNRGTSSMHNTASMVGWSEEPFVGVSFNYRVGALGFLPSSLTAKEGALNLGLRDQILLLRWVQDNIEAFGGDPSQVTVFGLSAGAHSIGHHILSLNSSPPLFHRAIIESGAALSRAVHPYDANLHEKQFEEFVQEAGCADHAASEIFICLRSRPSETITNASFTVFDRYNPSVRWAFQPAIDGETVKQRPIDAWHSGKWNRMPIMTGFNTNEGTYYVPVSTSTSEEFTSFFRTLLPAYTEKDIKTINKLYPDPATDPSSPYVETRDISVGPQYKRVEAAYGHYAYACPVRQTATIASKGQEAPVFLYHWALNKTVQGGANHADQVPYEAFSPEIREISASQEEVSGVLHAYFTSFIVTGDPNAFQGQYAHRPTWEAYDASRQSAKVMVFGQGNDERAGGSGLGVAAQMEKNEWSQKECDFWWTKAGISD